VVVFREHKVWHRIFSHLAALLSENKFDSFPVIAMWHPQYCDEGIELSASKVSAKQRLARMSTLLAVPLAKLPKNISDDSENHNSWRRCFEVVIDANRGAVFVGAFTTIFQLGFLPGLGLWNLESFSCLILRLGRSKYSWKITSSVDFGHWMLCRYFHSSVLPSVHSLQTPFLSSLFLFSNVGTYAIDSYAGSVGTNGKWKAFADKKFRNGDVVTSELDLKLGTISYWLNGSPYFFAFTLILELFSEMQWVG
jgi:hypothetical protein